MYQLGSGSQASLLPHPVQVVALGGALLLLMQPARLLSRSSRFVSVFQCEFSGYKGGGELLSTGVALRGRLRRMLPARGARAGYRFGRCP